MEKYIEFIKIEWADIRHMRLQDLLLLSVTGLMFLCIAIRILDDQLRYIIFVLSFFFCSGGIIVAFSHWGSICQKLGLIRRWERAVGANLVDDRNLLSVQGVILFLYFIIMGLLFGWFAWFLHEDVVISVVVFAIVALIGLVVFIIGYHEYKHRLIHFEGTSPGRSA